MGVLHIARRVFDSLARQHVELRPYRALTLVCALLHDIGHSPFSHAGEEMFGCHHELWTQRIITEDPQIDQLLREQDPQLPEQMAQVYTKQFPLPMINQLISSQLDCDRFDYLLRDGLLTGAQYGHLDLDRILTVMNYDPERQSLLIPARKGLGPIEHYLSVRYFMYTQVYQHPKSLAARFVLDRLFKRARVLLEKGKLKVDPILTAWLQGPVDQLALADYLAADDVMFSYPLRFWSTDPDPILSDLARRYLDRDLFKARNISHLSEEQRQDLQVALGQRLLRDGLDPDSYRGVRTARIQGYTLYQQGISLQTDQGLKEIAELSPLVKSLVEARPQLWLVFPRRYTDTVEEFLCP